MSLSIVAALCSFLLGAASSGAIGNAAYDALCKVCQKRRKKSIVSLYVQAFQDTIDEMRPSLTGLIERNADVAIDSLRLRHYLSHHRLELTSYGALSEELVTQALVECVERFVILPGSQLSELEQRALAVTILRQVSGFLLEQIAEDEHFFRVALLQDS